MISPFPYPIRLDIPPKELYNYPIRQKLEVKRMDEELFSGLADLGFKDIEDIDLFKKSENELDTVETEIINDVDRERSLLYDREVVCPVCEKKFLIKTIKKSSNKAIKRESDFYVHYNLINPYFYEVWLCNHCGYAALSSDFLKIKPGQISLVKQKVTPKWQNKIYPDTYNVNIALERYKLALLNYFFTDDVASKKAMTCLKIAWMYRLLKDNANELIFQKQAIEGFEHAYTDEKFPFYEMDEFMVQYLIGEMHRRTGNDDKALSWFGKVITSFHAKQNIKEKARDQRDLIIETRRKAELTQNIESANVATDATTDVNASKKSGFFSKFFNK
jgi:uncharacterized protein